MKSVLFPAGQRGSADHGWLKTYYSFSFASYYNPDYIHFGCLRVLNDDYIEAGMGFGKHPHDNMEIITIPLEGDLKHGDSMGNEGIIKNGDVQVMSAGTGIIHSEMNANRDKPVKLLQIWVFPRERNLPPRYDQISIADGRKKNDFQQVVSPNKDESGAWIHQDAWFYLGDFDKGVVKNYSVKKEGNGLYIFVISGGITVEQQKLQKRDALGIIDVESVAIQAEENSEFLIIDIPMELPDFVR